MEFEKLLVIALALVLMALLLWILGQLPRMLLSYEITNSKIRVLLLRSLPIYQIPFHKIKGMHEASFYEVALVPGVHLFTRPFAKRVVIEMRGRWFIFAFLTPSDPGAFIAEVKRHMTRF